MTAFTIRNTRLFVLLLVTILSKTTAFTIKAARTTLESPTGTTRTLRHKTYTTDSSSSILYGTGPINDRLGTSVSSLSKLRDSSSLAPNPSNGFTTCGQWALFSGIIAGISLLFHQASVHEWLNVRAATWNYVAIGYPAVIGMASIFNLALYSTLGGAGKTIAERMGGIPCEEDSQVILLLSQVYVRSGLPPSELPQAYIIPTSEPNAFAAGTAEKSVIGVTTGLLDQLSENEIRAVLAHEVGHLRNSDTRQTVQLAAMIAALATAKIIGELLMRTSSGSSSRDESGDSEDNNKSSGGNLHAVGLILYATGIVTVVVGSLLRLGSSRSAEYAADAFVKSIGIGDDLACALETISGVATEERKRESHGLGFASGAFAHSYINNPPSRESPYLTLFGLLSTHPSTQDRVARLLEEGDEDDKRRKAF